MERLAPIPTPPAQLLRQCCHRGGPVLAFLGAALAVVLLWNDRFSGSPAVGESVPVRSDLLAMDAMAGTGPHARQIAEIPGDPEARHRERLDQVVPPAQVQGQ